PRQTPPPRSRRAERSISEWSGPCRGLLPNFGQVRDRLSDKTESAGYRRVAAGPRYRLIGRGCRSAIELRAAAAIATIRCRTTASRPKLSSKFSLASALQARRQLHPC